MSFEFNTFRHGSIIVLMLVLLVSTFLFPFLFWVYSEKLNDQPTDELCRYVGKEYSSFNADCSCLNKIYDEIFVISIPSRTDTLRLTLFQLATEQIDYTIWKGHNKNSSDSLRLWHIFRNKIRNSMKLYESNPIKHSDGKRIYTDMKEIKYVNSAYNNTNVFFLRQTQIDIIKYSLSRNYSKILLLEDDILLSNPEYINMFCKYESDLPEWLVLNLGINQYGKSKVKLINVANSEQTQAKYYIKTSGSMGTFAISFSSKIFKTLINLFDFDPKHMTYDYDYIHFANLSKIVNQMRKQKNLLNVYALDNYYRFIRYDDYIKNHCFNVHPNLVLPDVTVSSMRPSRNQLEFIVKNTLNNNPEHFSKYWNLRFMTTDFH